MSSKSDTLNRVKIILKRLFKGFETDNEISEVEDDDIVVMINNDETESDCLNKKIESSIKRTLQPHKMLHDDYRSLLKEFNIYELTGKLTANLERLKDALNTIVPTSTQIERNFSISNNFCSRIRSALSDKSLDCLCFLKAYFLHEAKQTH